jgi:hypothetical protein
MSQTISSIRTVQTPAALAVCLAACACGLVGRVIEALRSAQPSLLLGLSPLELLAIFMAARLILSSQDADKASPRVIWPAALLLLPPSGAGAWLVLGLVGLAQAQRTQGEARAGYLLFAMLGVAQLWVTIGFKVASGPLLALDAQLIAWVMQGLGFAATRIGNVVEIPDGNTIVVLLTCATFHRMPVAIIAALSLSAPAAARDLAPVIARVAAGYFILNMGRLCAMGWSPESYAFMHDGTGASLYDGAQTLLVILAARRGRS